MNLSPAISQTKENNSNNNSYILNHINEIANLDKKNFWLDITQNLRTHWHSWEPTRKYSEERYPDESKHKSELIWKKEEWTDEQKQVYLVNTFEGFKNEAREMLYPGKSELSKKEKETVNRQAYIEMAKSHNGDGDIGDYFRNIMNMELDTKIGRINFDWLFTIGKRKSDLGSLLSKAIPTKGMYFAGKIFWGVVRVEEPNLKSSDDFFIKSNLNSVEAHDLLYEGQFEMADLFPDLKGKNVSELYDSYFKESKFIEPQFEEPKDKQKLGGIRLGGPEFDLKYLSIDDRTGESFCSYRYGGDIDSLYVHNSNGLITEDIMSLWLQYPKEIFWVNLHPDEPERILDTSLRSTISGNILLLADFQMKKDIAWLIHPDSSLGKEYWDGLYSYIESATGEARGYSIPVSFRVWLVPGEIRVFANESEIYVNNAEWDVLMEREYKSKNDEFESESISKVQLEEISNYSTRFFEEFVIPKLKSRINTSVEYSRLRELLYGAVIAEWYKRFNNERGLKGQQYKIEGDMAMMIFESYRQSYLQGEYNLKRTTEIREENKITTETKSYFNGGIDLSGLSKESFSNCSIVELLNENSLITQTLGNSIYQPFGYNDGSSLWIGGKFESE